MANKQVDLLKEITHLVINNSSNTTDVVRLNFLTWLFSVKCCGVFWLLSWFFLMWNQILPLTLLGKNQIYLPNIIIRYTVWKHLSFFKNKELSCFINFLYFTIQYIYVLEGLSYQIKQLLIWKSYFPHYSVFSLRK